MQSVEIRYVFITLNLEIYILVLMRLLVQGIHLDELGQQVQSTGHKQQVATIRPNPNPDLRYRGECLGLTFGKLTKRYRGEC